MSVYKSLIDERVKQYRKAHDEKVALLSDAAKMDKYVSGISQQVSPTMKMADKKKADLLTDRVDLSIDESSPMKGFGPAFRQRFAQELAKPDNAGYTTRAIASGITKHMLLEPDKKGVSRLERAYQNYRVEASNRGALLFTKDTDPNRKPPAAPSGLPTYSQWKESKRAQEDVRIKEEFTNSGYVRSVLDTTAIGVAAGAALGFGASLPTGGTAAPITVPVAAAIGGLVTGAAETIAYPWRRYVAGTEWGRAREDRGTLTDHAKTLAAKYLPDVVAQGAAEIKLIKSVTKLQGLKELAKLKPDAKTLALTKEAEEEALGAASAVNKKAGKKEAAEAAVPMGKKKQAGVRKMANYVKQNNLDIPKDEYVDAGKKWAQLSKAGKATAADDPDGLLAGTMKQFEKEEALKFATGEVTADDVIKKVKPEKKAVLSQEEIDKAEELKNTLGNLHGSPVPRKLIEDQAELARRGVSSFQEGKELVLYQGQTGKTKAQVVAEKVVNQEMKASKAGKDLLEVVGQETQGEVIDRAGKSAIDYMDIPESLQKYATDENSIERLTNISGAELVAEKVAPPTDNVNLFYRPAVRIDDEIFYVDQGIHITAVEKGFKELGIDPKNFDYSRIKGTGAVGPDGNYYEHNFLGDVPTSKKDYDFLVEPPKIIGKDSFFGKRLEKDPVVSGVADSFDEMGRPIDKIGRRLETESQMQARLAKNEKAIEDNTGNVFKEDIRSPYTDELLVSKGTVATKESLEKILNEGITPDRIPGMMQKKGLSVVEGGKKAVNLPSGITPIQKTIKGSHKSSNIASLEKGFEQRDLGVSIARDRTEELSSPTIKDAKGTPGRVEVEVTGNGLDYNNSKHKAYIDKLFNEAEKANAGPYDTYVLNKLRKAGIAWVDNFNGIGKSKELHVLDTKAIKITNKEIGKKATPKEPNMVTGIHHGSFQGGKIADALRSKDDNILGPGIYFSTDPNIAKNVYSKQGPAYTIDIDLNDFFDPIKGLPEGRKATVELWERISADAGMTYDELQKVSHSTMKHGRGDIGALHKVVGPVKAREILLKHGIKGAKEKLPSGSYEIAVFDESLLKKATPDLDETLAETERVLAAAKEADYSYATVTKKQLDEILEKGSVDEKGLTLRPDADKARSTKKGSTLVKVKKGDSKDIQIEFEDKLVSVEDYRNIRELKVQYDEVGDYYDELLVKHYPELDLASHDPEMITKVMRKASTLQDELVGYEKQKLETMLEKYDGLERVTSKFKEVIPDISVDDMRTTMVDIMKSEKKGKITAVEAMKQVEDIKMRTLQSPTMDGTDKYPSIEAMDNYLARLSKQAGIVGFFAAFGVGAALLDAISPDEAEAMPFGSVAKALGGVGKEVLEAYTKETGEALFRQGLSKGRVISDTVYNLSEKGFMTGLKETAHGGPKYILKNLDKIYRSSSRSLRRGMMSPQMQFYEILKQEPGILTNPAVFKATFYNSEVVNIQNGLKVASNIFKDGNVASAKKELGELFEPLTPLAKKQYQHDYHTEMAGEVQKRLDALKTPTKEEVAELKKQIATHTTKADRLKSAVATYHKEYLRFGEEAAKRHSSSRVFFAADDSVRFEKYPFMKNIPLTQDEMLTVGRLKNQMSVYRVRLEKEGIATKSGAYMHYILHPSIKSDTLGELTGNVGAAPYLRNYTRSFNSRPMMPDAVESMGKYVVGTEKRIQEQAFWKSGWDKVAYKSRYNEPMKKAFDDLRAGTIPYADNFINNSARMYTNIEVFKRLFLLPSAGLKHLVKVTGDMSTLGPTVVFQSMGAAAKGVSHRIIQDTPKLDFARRMLNNPGQYTKLKKQLLDSIVPARDTRYRMMQMGFGDYDSMFSKLNVMADQVNHIGGAWINLAEFFDRSLTFEAGMRMAAKKGMTPEQAIYGIYDTLLKNNFLGREFTPALLKHPVFKAFFLFQTTPAKILGKKLSVAMVAQKPIRDLGKHIFNSTKTAEGRHILKRDLLNLWSDMQRVEQESKVNLILDTIRQEKDFYGTNVVSQFAKDLLVIGAGTGLAASVGLDMHVHFFHLPFIKSTNYSEEYGTLSISPGVKSILEGHDAYKTKIANDEDSMLFHEVFQKWAQKSGPFPSIFHKIHRISENDIPDIYSDSALQYLFAIPSVKEKD